jgi:Effector Associated Constant Component 1
MQAAIRIDSADMLTVFEAYESLHSWLGESRPLRGAVTLDQTMKPGDMGGVADVLVVALGSGGAVTALAASLGSWLYSRRSHVKIKVTAPDGSSIEIDAKRAKGDQAGVEELLRETLNRPPKQLETGES